MQGSICRFSPGASLYYGLSPPHPSSLPHPKLSLGFWCFLAEGDRNLCTHSGVGTISEIQTRTQNKIFLLWKIHGVVCTQMCLCVCLPILWYLEKSKLFLFSLIIGWAAACIKHNEINNLTQPKSWAEEFSVA